MNHRSPRADRRRSRWVAGPVLAATLLAACGGSSAVQSNAASVGDDGSAVTDPVALAARVAQVAEDNIPLLESADSVFDVEVLDVADGSISTLRDVVTGDRPVLVWFYSPH